MNKSETIKNIAGALNKAQAEMSGAKKSANNPFFRSSYANLEEVINCVKEPFANNGLSFVQFPISGEGLAGVETIIMHESGEFISGEFLLKCSKNDPQGMGSAITYAPLMTAKDAASKLETAKTVDDLVKVWNSLPIDVKQVESVIAAKDKKKAGLTK
jgi:hypothetical protein